MEMEELIYHVPGLLSEWHCNQLIDYYKSQEHTCKYEGSKNLKNGKWEESNFKVVDVPFDNLPGQIIHQMTGKMIDAWCEKLYGRGIFHVMRPLLRCSQRYRILCYEEGSYIHPHVDWDHFIHASCTFNLNEDYTGGTFMFMNRQFGYDLKRGDALIFPASPYWCHEVTPIVTGTRYSVNSFITSLPEDIRKEIVKRANESIPA